MIGHSSGQTCSACPKPALKAFFFLHILKLKKDSCIGYFTPTCKATLCAFNENFTPLFNVYMLCLLKSHAVCNIKNADSVNTNPDWMSSY